MLKRLLVAAAAAALVVGCAQRKAPIKLSAEQQKQADFKASMDNAIAKKQPVTITYTTYTKEPVAGVAHKPAQPTKAVLEVTKKIGDCTYAVTAVEDLSDGNPILWKKGHELFAEGYLDKAGQFLIRLNTKP